MLSRTDRLYTAEEYARLREPDDVRSELVRGRLVREPRPQAPHAWVQLELASRLREHVRARDAGFVLTDVGVLLSRDPDTVRGPDVAYLSAERAGGRLPSGFLEVAPDLVAEIVSPSNTATDIHRRVREYLEAGVSLVWVVDPASRTATVYGAGGEGRMIGEEGALSGGEVVPGFTIPLRELLP